MTPEEIADRIVTTYHGASVIKLDLREMISNTIRTAHAEGYARAIKDALAEITLSPHSNRKTPIMVIANRIRALLEDKP